jgi:type I restriction enzyme R subunit
MREISMRSVNFEFLQAAAPRLTELAALAESYAHSDPAGCAIKARAFVEQAARDLYADAGLQTVPRPDLLELLRGAEFQQVVPSSVLDKMHAIRKTGNVGAHGGDVQPRIALDVIRELFDVARWLFLSRYGGALSDVPEFQPVPPGGATGATKSALQRDRREALQKLAAQNARFEELVGELEKERAAKHTAEAEASRLREAMVSRGPAAAAELQFDEATTRQRLIDTMLVEAGWDVGADGVNTREVEREVEVHDQPTDTAVGKCDYVMWGEDGKPLMLVEVKRTSVDARDGQTQARLYADALARQYGRRPVIVFSNGFEIWLWDDAAGWPPRKLHGHYSKDSIEQLIRQRTSAQPFDSLPVNPAIVDRLYQYEAIRRVTERFADTRRKALVVQATGTGKTRVAIALSDLMLRLGRGRRVLFLCDRRELRKQARDAFTSFTPHSPVIVRASTAKERHHRIYLATYPAMMQVFQSFDPGFFDIIFADESHRSIYNVYGDLFRWFDGYQVGLTATPVEMISRSTCELFGCQRNDPTFNYPYEEAVEWSGPLGPDDRAGWN